MMVPAEERWITALSRVNDPAAAVRDFAAHYHFFSLHQVRSLAKLIQHVPPTDYDVLAEVGQVLFDELGEGCPDRVHSVLFHNFAVGVGVPPDELPLADEMVTPAIKAYLAELDRAFSEGPFERAMAAYVFLERSAVKAYRPLLETFTKLGVNARALEFFEVHTDVELRHAGAADRIAARQGWSDQAGSLFGETMSVLAKRWDEFWSELCSRCRA